MPFFTPACVALRVEMEASQGPRKGSAAAAAAVLATSTRATASGHAEQHRATLDRPTCVHLGVRLREALGLEDGVPAAHQQWGDGEDWAAAASRARVGSGGGAMGSAPVSPQHSPRTGTSAPEVGGPARRHDAPLGPPHKHERLVAGPCSAVQRSSEEGASAAAQSGALVQSSLHHCCCSAHRPHPSTHPRCRQRCTARRLACPPTPPAAC